MEKAGNAQILLDHYKNIQNLSLKQLDSIKQGTVADLSELIAQKQLIIEHIQKNESDYNIHDFPAEVIDKLRKVLSEIAAIEEESRALLNNTKELVRGQIVASKQGNMLRTAYENPHSVGYVVNRLK